MKGFIGNWLYNWKQEFAKMMEEEEASNVALMDGERYNGIEVFDVGKAKVLVDDYRRFIYGGLAAAAMRTDCCLIIIII